MNPLVERALSAYGISSTEIYEPETGYRNTSYAAQLADGKKVNLIIYKDENDMLERIKRTNLVANYVAATGLPARTTYDERVLRLRVGARARYASLYNYLPGVTIPWQAYTKHHIKLLGEAMGKLHSATATLDYSTTNLAANEYIAVANRMLEYFKSEGVITAMSQKLKLSVDAKEHIFGFNSLMKATKKLPGQRMLHMDMVRSNILFSDNDNGLHDGPVTLSGILDFEKTAYGHPVYDLARTYAFLLVDCKYKTPEKIEKYFFRSGYAKRGGGAIPVITYKDTDVLHELTSFFLLHDFYKFLRHNPFESLEDNEHYVRTRNILIERGLVVAQ